MKTHKLQPVMTVLALVTLALIVSASQGARAAGPRYVAPGGNDSNTCASPGAPCATINGAIGKAGAGDTIYVATDTYTGTGSEVVSLNISFTLSGGGNSDFAKRRLGH